MRVALAGVDINTAALVERQKRRIFLSDWCTYRLVQVHSKVSYTPYLEFQQTGLVIPLKLILTNSILIVLSAGVAFQLKGKNCNAVKKDYKVNVLYLFVLDFLHYREDISLIQHRCLLVEVVADLRNMMVKDTPLSNAVFKHIQQAAVFLIDLIVNVVENGLAGLVAIELFRPSQRILLGCFQKGEQQIHIRAVARIVSCEGRT